MSKQLNSSRYILKINSTRLKDANWELNLPFKEARARKEIISLGDSQILRFIRRINNVSYTEEEISNVKKEIKFIKTNKNAVNNRERIKCLYDKLDDMLFIKDYISIVFDSKSDFDRATNKNGFTVNGVKFKRFVGTTGGVKLNTVMFVNEDIYNKLNEMVECGWNKETLMIPAKFEAYKALSASVSTPVTMPRILVIKDGTVRIKGKVIKVSGEEKFKVEHNTDYETDKDFTDGAGMISPKMSEIWARDMNLDYLPSGFNTRFAYEKGMLVTFPFLEFAEDINRFMVEDCWGAKRDIREVDVILTTNMVKLWSAYDSLEDYLENCSKYGWDFCVSKVCPKELEHKRNMNYQYLQSYEDMSDSDIDELIKETIENINGALGDDPIKQILFLKGIHMNDKNIQKNDYDFLKALLIDRRVCNDTFIKQKVLMMIEKKIKDAKKGVVQVDGNYSIICGDLYALCQSMFGLNITGILGAEEFYSNTWIEKGVYEVVAFRSPMTSHNNVKRMKLISNELTNRWFRFAKTITFLNAWDFTTDALNGADFDSDAIITTNNPIILNNTKDMLPIICEQRSVKKVKVTENLLKKSNKDGFGNDVGSITNKVTAMFDVLAGFDKNSDEYSILMDRIICGQAYQQESIDKIKGIKAKEMPKEWFDYKSIMKNQNTTDKEKEFEIKLMVNKKPYFFIYNYPKLYSEHIDYVKKINRSCMMDYNINYLNLTKKEDKTEDEEIFLDNVKRKMPVFKNPSVMNRICWRLEEEFKNVKLKVKDSTRFNYDIYKTKKPYDKTCLEDIKKLMKVYSESQKNHTAIKHLNTEEKAEIRKVFLESFKIEALKICSNEEDLCNIVVDIAYGKNNKQFAWDVCGDRIIKNLLIHNKYKIKYPMQDENGSIIYNGYRFSEREIEVCEE